MKFRSAIYFFLLAITLSLSAQEDLYLTCFGSIQRTSIYNKLERKDDFLKHHVLYESGLDYKFKPTYCSGGGFYLRRRLKGRFDLGVGALYGTHQQKYRFYIRKDDFTSNGRIRLEYLKVPLFVAFHIVQREKFKAFFAAGPQLRLLLSEDGGFLEFSPDFTWLSFAFTGSKYREFGLDGVVFAATEFEIAKNFSLFSQLRFDYGFTDTENKKAVEMFRTDTMFEVFTYTYYKRPVTHNISYGLSLGFTHKIVREKRSEKTSNESYF